MESTYYIPRYLQGATLALLNNRETLLNNQEGNVTMGSQIIDLITNIGKVIQLVKDIEKSVNDISAKNAAEAKPDVLALLNDVEALAALINLPGVTPEQLKAVFENLKKVVAAV
jgi:hypothetical protein